MDVALAGDDLHTQRPRSHLAFGVDSIHVFMRSVFENLVIAMRIAGAVVALILHFTGAHGSQRLLFTLLILSLSPVVQVWSPSIIYILHTFTQTLSFYVHLTRRPATVLTLFFRIH